MSQLSIYELRMRAGLRQGRVARKAGIVQSTLCSIEKGYRAPTPEQVATITAAIEELSRNPFLDIPLELSQEERAVWRELERICPKLEKVPPRSQCIRIVKLLAKMRKEGIGNRDGKHGITDDELERLLYLFDVFRMTPVSRGAVPMERAAS